MLDGIIVAAMRSVRASSVGARAWRVLPLLAVTVLVAGCGSESEAAPATTAPATSATPSRPAPATSDRAAAPATMTIPAIDIESRVEPVGTEDRVLQIPPQPWVVGWWKDGVAPGQGRGTVVLTAHLDSREYGAGPFVRAEDLKRGDTMTLTDADGVRHRYRVAAVDTFRKKALPYEELFDQRSDERVVFVTCGGSYDRRNGGWDSNVVVTFAQA